MRADKIPAGPGFLGSDRHHQPYELSTAVKGECHLRSHQQRVYKTRCNLQGHKICLVGAPAEE